jgi:LacI family transcriptional regulator
MGKRIRIKDIAERAGVSTGTVDRVIHNRGNVSPKARVKVLAVMEQLDYEPNIIASTLAYNRVTKIAAVFPDPTTDLYWSYPLQGVEKAAKVYRHYGVEIQPFYFDLFDSASFSSVASEALKSEPDALLFPPLFLKESEQILDACRDNNIMISFINTDIEGRRALCYVGQDSYQSGVLAGKLLNIGYRRPLRTLVLHLGKGTTNAKHLLDKERGIKDYFANTYEGDAPITMAHFEDFDNEAKLRDFLLEINRKHPGLSGIFVTNSRAYMLVKALKEEELAHLRIVGFDLLPKNLEYLDQRKISFLINQNPVQQGYLGVMNIVNKLIFKKEINRIQHLPLDIVVSENAKYYLEREFQFAI